MRSVAQHGTARHCTNSNRGELAGTEKPEPQYLFLSQSARYNAVASIVGCEWLPNNLAAEYVSNVGPCHTRWHLGIAFSVTLMLSIYCVSPLWVAGAIQECAYYYLSDRNGMGRLRWKRVGTTAARWVLVNNNTSFTITLECWVVLWLNTKLGW